MNSDLPEKPQETPSSGGISSDESSAAPVARLSIQFEAKKPVVTYILVD